MLLHWYSAFESKIVFCQIMSLLWLYVPSWMSLDGLNRGFTIPLCRSWIQSLIMSSWLPCILTMSWSRSWTPRTWSSFSLSPQGWSLYDWRRWGAYQAPITLCVRTKLSDSLQLLTTHIMSFNSFNYTCSKKKVITKKICLLWCSYSYRWQMFL